MPTRDVVPRADLEGNLGSLLKRWLKGFFSSIHTTDITNGAVTASVADLADAVTKKHTQGTDQGLDTGGPNAVTAAAAKNAADKAHDAATAGTGINVTGQQVKIADTAVAPGAYHSANITIDQQGRITLAASGGYDYVKVSDKKALGTRGGTFTTGAWQKRDVQTEDSDASGICSLASNQITLAAGTYDCAISCPAMNVGGHVARLYNVTGAVQLLLGSNTEAYSSYSQMTRSFIIGRFTLAVQSVLEIQHRGSATINANGYGEALSITDEIYTMAEFRRVA